MKTAHCVNLGCSENHLDGALISRHLETNDWVMVDDPREADLIILNSCAFTRDAERNSLETFRRLQALRRPDARVIFAGCLPAINRNAVRAAGYDDILVTPRTLHRLDDIMQAATPLDETRSGCVPASSDGIGLSFGNSDRFPWAILQRASHRLVSLVASFPFLPLPRWLWQALYLPDHRTEVVRISVGCLNQCAFCAIPRAKGATRSVPLPIIVERVESAIARGTRIIALSCDELASYGQDISTDIVALLDRLTALPGDFKLVLRNVHPEWFIRYWAGLAPIFGRGRIAYMVMPVQSGSDAILNAMRRNHGHREYRQVLAELRRVSPRTIVRTHLLVGFPGETETDFQATLDLARTVPLDSYFVHAYSERDFTASAGLPGAVGGKAIARRVKRLRNADLLNWLRPSRWLPLRP